MAKALARCTCKTCGKQFDYVAYKRNSSEARSFEAWAVEHITECDDCEKIRIEEERKAENEKAAEMAKVDGWPALTGSERQIAWANTIRMKTLLDIKEAEKSKRNPEVFEAVRNATYEWLMTRTESHWWIEWKKDLLTKGLAIQFALKRIEEEDEDRFNEISTGARDHDLEKIKGKSAARKEPEAAEIEKPILVPEDSKHEGTVQISIQTGKDDTLVKAVYVKDNTFIETVKDLGFRWDRSCWFRSVNFKTGSADNLGAVLGNKLLNAGYTVQFPTKESARMAQDGTYEPITKKWITIYGSNNKCFVIDFGRDDKLYNAARKIPGSRYETGDIIVSTSSWREVLDFADRYGFKISDGAMQMISEMENATKVVKPAPVKEDEPEGTDVLNSSREVLDDLKD